MCFLVEQGLPLCRDGDEQNSNINALLSLREENDTVMCVWVKCSGCNYTSPPIRKDIFKIMAAEVLHEISICLHNSAFITFMMDETTDISNREQAIIVMHYVTCEMEVMEEFIGLYHSPATDSKTLTEVVKDCLSRCNLPLSKLRG